METITKSRYLNFEIIEPYDNLKITLTDEGKEELEYTLGDKYNTKPNEQIWSELLEQTACNGSYAYTDANEVGGLTESPMIINYKDIDNDGNVVFHKDTIIWWFPHYMIIDPLQGLLEDGYVIFQKS